jgi:hypothetical protein
LPVWLYHKIEKKKKKKTLDITVFNKKNFKIGKMPLHKHCDETSDFCREFTPLGDKTNWKVWFLLV